METILIIDDSLFNIKYLSRMLEKEYKVIFAINGESGLKLAKESSPSLILLDIEMPGINGFEVMERLQLQKETQHIPVVFLTGVDNIEAEERAFFFGAVDYIRKPFSINVVCARVRTHINLFRYRRILEAQMYIDVLTGLYTRKHAIEYLAEQWDKCVKKQIPFSIGIADIDFFKKVNDTHGHHEGDRVLSIVSRVLKESLLKHNGYIARMGGEEFCIVLTGKTKEEAEELMNITCNAVSAEEIYKGGDRESDRINVTLSIGGVTLIPTTDLEMDEISKKADEMLYRAKNSGRNQVDWI